ncbi:MAG: hypothetical protein ACE5LC_02465 [Candidatus Aminicenantales bacterium]
MKEEHSRYFQEIANHFIAERGAPFFLSSVDIELIQSWERMKIPLDIVLEGIKKAFQERQIKSGKRGRVRSLVSCRYHVLRAFEQYRERRVGVPRKEAGEARQEKRRRIKKETENFMALIPPELSYLEDIYQAARHLLSRKEVDEAKLEQLDQKVEELLFSRFPQEEKEKIKEKVWGEYPSADDKELDSLVKIKTVKFLRDKYKIPYLSFYYY